MHKYLQPVRVLQGLFGGLGLLFLLALLNLVLHLFLNGQYGYFRDELAYVDDAKRLDWGYVDHPPLTALIGSFARLLFGDSLLGLRFFPALASAALVFLTGLMVRELGGGRFAQVGAALCIVASPAYQVFGLLFQALPFEQFLWVLCCYLLIRLLKTDNPKLWPWIGLTIGLSAMNKYSVFFFVVGLVLALLLTPARKYFKSPWLWLGAGLGIVIFLPNLIWQIQHNFVSLDYNRSINARDVAIGRTDGFLLEQFSMLTNPLSVPVWLAGLYYFLFKEKSYRLFGLIYLVVLALFIVLHGRFYYLAPAYPVLMAGGAYIWEKWLVNRRIVKFAWLGLVALTGLLFVPLTLPLLPAGSAEWKTISQGNDAFREMIGWQELVASIAAIYSKLPAQEQANTALLANNYGEAGAINFYGSTYGLPQAISPVNSYYYWSQGRLKADTYIVLGYSPARLQELQSRFNSVEQVATVSNRYAIENEETNYAIYLCRRPKTPLTELWPSMQRYS